MSTDAPRRRSASGPLVLAAGSAVLVVIGLVVFLGAVRVEREVAAMNGWPSAPGTLLRADLVPELGGRRGTTPGWGVVLDYRWEAGGTVHHGSRLAVGRRWSELRPEAHAWITPLVGRDTPITRIDGGGERWTVEVPVTVWYDPADPSRSVLDRRDWGGPRALARATGAGFLLLGLVGLAMVALFWSRRPAGA